MQSLNVLQRQGRLSFTRRPAFQPHLASSRLISSPSWGVPACLPVTNNLVTSRSRQRCCTTASRRPANTNYGGGQRSFGPDWKDRVIATLPYLLPFVSAYSYGKFLFYQVPVLQLVVSPFLPLISLYHSIPFASLICFLGLYAGVATNNSFTMFVRLHTMQAVLLDILLIVPRLIEHVVGHPSGGAMLEMYITFQNCVWLGIAGAVAYGIFNSIMGQQGKLPFVGDAAEQQMR